MAGTLVHETSMGHSVLWCEGSCVEGGLGDEVTVGVATVGLATTRNVSGAGRGVGDERALLTNEGGASNDRDLGGDDAFGLIPALLGRVGPHGDGLEDGVGGNAGNHAVGDGVGEGEDGNGKEGGESLLNAGPIDELSCGHHEHADHNQRSRGSEGRNGRKDGREGNGEEEADANSDSVEASLGAILDTSAGLVVDNDRGGADAGTDHGGHGGGGEGLGGTGQGVSLEVEETALVAESIVHTGGVKDADEEDDEGDREGHGKVVEITCNVELHKGACEGWLGENGNRRSLEAEDP